MMPRMANGQVGTGGPGVDTQRSRPRRAWFVAVVTLAALVAAAAFRSSTGVLMEPIEREFGWTRATTAGAVSLNLVLYGIVLIVALRFLPNGIAGLFARRTRRNRDAVNA